MIALVIVLIMLDFVGWGVLRIAMMGGSYDGDSFNFLDGFALLVLLFLIVVSVWFSLVS